MQIDDYYDGYPAAPRGCAIAAIMWLILVVLGVLFLFNSCTTIKEVPVETIKTKIEYRDKLQFDSIYIHDSINVTKINDTITINNFKYKYKYKLLKDTINIVKTDSIPYTVEVLKETNKLTSWQRWQLAGFWILTIGIIGINIYKLYKKLKV